MSTIIVVGGLYHLKNLYAEETYLDTCGNATCDPTTKYNVLTSTSPDRAGSGTAIWKIISVDKKPDGSPVRVGDSVYLKNLYAEGTYLDSCGTTTCDATTKYDVSTSTSPDRAGSGTGTWKIISFFKKPDGTPVRVCDLVHLKNLYAEGTYLDSCGTATCDATTKYNVSTSTSPTREGSGTGTWTFIPALLTGV